MYRRRLLALAVALAGCSDRSTSTPTPASPTDEDAGADEVGYTYLRANGNRYVEGAGRLPDGDAFDVSLPTTPAWVVGVPDDGATLWVTVLDDGRVRAFRLGAAGVTDAGRVTTTGNGPPLLVFDGDAPRVVNGGSRLSHPVPVEGGSAVVDRGGALALPGGGVDVDVLTDARIVKHGGRLFVFARPTNAYDHGVLGDDTEAGGVAIVDPARGVVDRVVAASEGAVFEGIAPIVTDVDGDGDAEILVTESDAETGSRLVAFETDGTVAAAGPPVGTGYRWRHQLAVAPFGPDGQREAAAVKTPHLDGVAEFYRADGEDLQIVATDAGYASHRIGSRNLDMAAAGDFDGDGRVELLVPDGTGERLVAVRREGGDARAVWTVPVGGRLATNVAAVRGARGVAVCAGHAGGLRFWR
ncbi:MAG: hypothetical protein ABEJ78_06040 [Haloferacaceae archaeon]